MKKSYTPLAFLLLTIAVAGCTALPSGNQGDDTAGNVKVTLNDGLSVDFGSVDAEYFEGDRAIFSVQVENTGEHRASSIDYSLTGAAWAAGDVSSGSSKLQGVEKANNIAGQQDAFDIRTDPINLGLSAGQSDSAEVVLNTEYTYRSSTRSKLTLLSTDRYREQNQARQKMKNDIKGAPVHITFDGLSPAQEQNSGPFVNINTENVGDGTVFDDQDERGRLTKLVVERPTGGTVGECSWRNVRMTRTLSCDLGDLDLSSGVDEQTFTLVAKATYTYEEEDSTTFRVIGEGGGGDSNTDSDDDDNQFGDDPDQGTPNG